MIERFRAFLDQPLGHGAAQAILFLSSAILVGLAVLFVLTGGEPASRPHVAEPRPAQSGAGFAVAGVSPSPAAATRPPWPRHDPQDREGSPAARRAARALEAHRALQHVPFESEALTVELVGARGHRALLRVTASTIGAAQHGWRKFLRRYQDTGHAYIPIFRAQAARGGEGRDVRSGSAVPGLHRSRRAAVARHVDRAVARPVMRRVLTRAGISDSAALCGPRTLPTSLRHPKVGA